MRGAGYVLIVFGAFLCSRGIVLCYIGIVMGEMVGKKLSATKRQFLRSRLGAWCRRCCCSATQPAEEVIKIRVDPPNVEEKRAEFLREKARLSEALRALQAELDVLPSNYEEDVGRAWLRSQGHAATLGPDAIVVEDVTRAPSLLGFLRNPLSWMEPV